MNNSTISLTAAATTAASHVHSSAIVKQLTESGKHILTTFAVLMSIIALYLSTALITHRASFIKDKKDEKKSRKKRNGTSVNWMDSLSVLASIVVLLSLTNDHLLFYTKDLSSFSCKLMQFISKLLYSSGHCCVYLFLWFRQRSCYRNPTLANIHNKICRFASAAILPFFIVMNVTGTVLTAFLWSFNTTAAGCVETNQSSTPLIALFVASASMQTTLLVLFLYPLKRHANFLSERAILSPADKVLARLIKRSITSTLLCVLADASSFAAAMSLDPQLPFIIKNYIYDGNLICNVACMVASFADWRCRIAPWCTKQHVTKFERTGSTFASTTAYTTSLKAATIAKV